jgi:tetratricopeptide (TPR) repeat protein
MLENEFAHCLNLFNSGDIKNAIIKGKDLIKKYPNNYELNKFLGLILANINNFDEALLFFNKCLEINKNSPEIYFNLGLIFKKKGLLDLSIKNYQEAIRLNPKFYDAYINLGVVFEQQNRNQDCLSILEKLIKQDKNNFKAYFNLGNIFKKIGNYEDSIKAYYQAIKINDQQAKNFYNLGLVLKKIGNYDDAIINYKKSIKLKPNYFEAYNNLGVIFNEQRKFSESFDLFETALRINPKFLEAYYNESFIFLLQNKFIEGWKRYEFRWTSEDQIKPLYNLKENIWDGKVLNGTLLVWSEQGIGDHLFFGRMVQCLKDQAKKIIFTVDKRLIKLFKLFFFNLGVNNIEVIEQNKSNLFVKYDKHIPAGSLGKFFANSENEILKFSTNNFTIKNDIDFKKITKFLNDLKGFKIGLSWKSLNKNEQHRNISLQKLVSILSNRNCSLVNLQFGDTNDEISQVEKNSLCKIHNLKDIDNFNNIDELSLLINNLDLVITIQNTTAHLSLGFQKKTFVLLPTNSRWHWGVSGERSPWYPAAQIFRQSKYNDWEDVLNNVKISLDKLFI